MKILKYTNLDSEPTLLFLQLTALKKRKKHSNPISVTKFGLSITILLIKKSSMILGFKFGSSPMSSENHWKPTSLSYIEFTTCFHEFFKYETTNIFTKISQLKNKTIFLLAEKVIFSPQIWEKSNQIFGGKKSWKHVMSSTLDKDRVLYKTIPDFFRLWCMQLEIAILEQKLKEF